MSEPSTSALTAALKIQKRAAGIGFDWPDADGPRAKIAEELAELDEATRCAGKERQAAKIAEELGDLLFAVVNYARHLGVEPEAALAAANKKFARRFRYIEERLVAQEQPRDLGLERLDALWDEAKRRLR